jgi:hypothetical protein
MQPQAGTPSPPRKDLSSEERRAARERRLRQERESLLNSEIRPPGVPKGINPHTRMPLRPGQRLPTIRLRDEAFEQRNRSIDVDALASDQERVPYPAGSFPIGPQWELVRGIVYRWLHHNFAARRGDTNYFRGQGDLAEGEWSQLLWDLDCFTDLCRRGLMDRGLPEYLAEGRENWGLCARALDQIAPGWRERYWFQQRDADDLDEDE